MTIQFQKQTGGIQYVVLVLILIFAVFLTGSLFVKTKVLDPTTYIIPNAAAFCCDTGDGPNCKPQTEEGKTITFQGKQYGLLRSNVKFLEGNVHLEDSTLKTPQGDPISLNDSGKIAYSHQQNPYITDECLPKGPDKYFKEYVDPASINHAEVGRFCTTAPDDIIIFVCKQNCHPATCTPPQGTYYIGNPSCYGDASSVYDTYYRIEDYEKSGKVMDFIANCDKAAFQNVAPPPSGAMPSQEIVFNGSSSGTQRLQLETFLIKQGTSSAYVPGVSPWCKPAIYLYPPTKMTMNVQVNSIRPLTYTIPSYPSGGWTVTAHPNGTITYNQKNYDYLYYETQVPDSEISEPEEGYIVKYDELNDFFKKTLPKLGLNAHESAQFEEYWLHSLPKAPKEVPFTETQRLERAGRKGIPVDE